MIQGTVATHSIFQGFDGVLCKQKAHISEGIDKKKDFAEIVAGMKSVPFLSRLLLLLPASSSLSAPFSFIESTLSTLICRFNELAGPRLEGRYSGVFFAEFKGLMNCLEGVLVGLASGTGWRLTLVNPELTAVKPLMAVNPDVTGCCAGACASWIGVSLSELT